MAHGYLVLELSIGRMAPSQTRVYLLGLFQHIQSDSGLDRPIPCPSLVSECTVAKRKITLEFLDAWVSFYESFFDFQSLPERIDRVIHLYQVRLRTADKDEDSAQLALELINVEMLLHEPRFECEQLLEGPQGVRFVTHHVGGVRQFEVGGSQAR